jgi:hypothetical protein
MVYSINMANNQVNGIVVGEAFGVPVVRIRRPSVAGTGRQLASDIIAAIREVNPGAVHPAARI